MLFDLYGREIIGCFELVLFHCILGRKLNITEFFSGKGQIVSTEYFLKIKAEFLPYGDWYLRGKGGSTAECAGMLDTEYTNQQEKEDGLYLHNYNGKYHHHI